MSGQSPRAVKFIRADLERLAADRCQAQVELERNPGERYLGTAEELLSDVGELHCVAMAAVSALQSALALGNDSIALHDVDSFVAFGREAVLVSLTAHHDGQARPLMGFCLKGQDPSRAAALAVLNATNRVLGIG